MTNEKNKRKTLRMHTVPIGDDPEMIDPHWFYSLCGEVHNRMVTQDGLAAFMAEHLEEIDPDNQMTEKELQCLTAMVMLETSHHMFCTAIRTSIERDEISDGLYQIIRNAMPCIISNANMLSGIVSEMRSNDAAGNGAVAEVELGPKVEAPRMN